MFEGLEARLRKVLDSPVDEAHDALKDILERFDPLLHNLANRIGGICHGLLDRFDVDIEGHFRIKLNPIEKGKPPIT